MSSRRAALRVRLTAAQNGLDPLTHYWFKVGRNEYRRICDSVAWRKGSRYKFPPSRECKDCRELKYADKEVGNRVFSLTYRLKGVFAPNPQDQLYIPNSLLELDKTMKPVSISTFTSFCIGSTAEQERIVRNIIRPGRFGPPYVAFYGMLNRTHLATKDLDSLRDAEPNLSPCGERYEKTRTAILELKKNYIAFWERERGEVCDVPKHFHTIISTYRGDLAIKIDPDCGIKTNAGEQALKLWLSAVEKRDEYSVVFHYLLQKARQEPTWPARLHLGVLDVPRQVFAYPPLMPQNIEEQIVERAADLLRRITDPSNPGPQP